MERKIGEIFEYNGEWYQCLIGNCCRECDFSSNNITCDIHGTLICTCNGRSDETSVVFKKLEKVGEPYELYGHLVQKYRFFYSPAIQIKGMSVSKTINTNNIIKIEIKQNKEDMEKKKLNLKPFDIQKAKEGEPVCTRDGRSVRILCFDMNSFNNHIIVALITEENGTESIYSYTSEGKWKETETKHDLMMLPEKKEGWVNVYKTNCGIIISEYPYTSKEEALKNIETILTIVDTIKIEWEE